MKNKFLSLLQKENNFTYTENGATALKSTSSALVDLFGCIGALRSRDAIDVERLFAAAFAESPLLAMKMLFYARNIRGGLGERRTFRVILKYLAVTRPELVIKNLDAIALFGRYDDFYTLVDTPAENEMWCYLKAQFETDLLNASKGQPISLLVKWLKSVNTSSEESRRLGKLTAKAFNLSQKNYRLQLAHLRKYLNVTEVQMSAGNWTDIIYSEVPSKAMSCYRNAFKAHDNEGFTAYIESLTKGEAKVNASTLFPYDIFEKLGLCWNYANSNSHFSFANYDALLEAQWKALPNYIEDEQNVLIMADTSGSMCGRPLCTALGLAIYFAERNKGAFKDVFMTFSSKPSLILLKGKTLYDKIKSVPSIVENTNLEAAFDLILKVATTNHLPMSELPKALVVITDMEFDMATDCRGKWAFYESMEKKYQLAGYSLPNVIFWNVNSRHDVFQVASDKKGVQLASGQSTAVFKSVLTNIGKTPYDAMVTTLSDPVYDIVSI